MVYLSPLSLFVVVKVLDRLCSWVCRLHYWLSKREHNRIGKQLGPVGWSGFPWPSRPPFVGDVAGCFSLLALAWRSSQFSRSPPVSGRRYLGRTGFWGGPSRSILWKPGCPGYRSVSSSPKTLTFTLVLKAGSLRKHTTFLLNYMRVLACRALETFHLGFVLPAFGPGFYLGPDIPALLGLMTEVDSFVFSPAPCRCLLRCLCPKVGIHHLCFHFSSGSFWFTLL